MTYEPWPYVPNTTTIYPSTQFVFPDPRIDELLERVAKLEKRLKRRPRRKKVIPE